MRTDPKGQVALITGAGGGIGRAIALRLAADGVRLALCGRTRRKLEETAALAGGTPVHIIEGDLLDPAFPAACIQSTIEAFGQLDILINNAGIAQSQPFEAITPEEYDLIMDTNVKAPFLLCQAALPALRASSSATIINIASVTAHKGYPLQSVYSASKHALMGLSRALAREVYKEGVRVHVISPGGVFTEMIRLTRPDLSDDGMILPEDIAEIAAFLIENRTNAVIDDVQVHRVGKEPFA